MCPSTREIAMRRRGVRRTVLAGLALALVVAGWTAIAVAAPPSPPPAPPELVGTNPTVQAWFQQHEPQRIALTNALQAANQQLAQGVPTDGCAQLQRAAGAMLGTLPTPKRALDALVVVGVDVIERGAQQCIGGDVAGARATLAVVGDALGRAQLAIDEILEKPNASVN
jgi:hypothetical protein